MPQLQQTRIRIILSVTNRKERHVLKPCEALVLLQCFGQFKKQERKGGKNLCERSVEERGREGERVREK